MAVIVRHPLVEDYILEMSLDEIVARRGGVQDLFEDGRLVVVKDYRLRFDFKALGRIDGNADSVRDPLMQKRLKKVKSTTFFEGAEPEPITGDDGRPGLRFADPTRQALFDIMCRGDVDIFQRASNALRKAHVELQRLFAICFPTYEPFRLIPSIRLTETLFENLHWDNHSIDDDFHQARIFCNLDTRKRVWNVSHTFTTFAEQMYDEHDLGRFAGKDPNLLVDYLAGDVLGGTRQTWKDNQPRHRLAFDPGEVWLGESRMISHQIYHGERAMVYMWFVNLASMGDSSKRFNARVDALHERMAARRKNAA